MKCKDPGTPTHGSRVINTGLIYGGYIDFRCNVGYTLVGWKRIFCQANKKWVAPAPTCKSRSVVFSLAVIAFILSKIALLYFALLCFTSLHFTSLHFTSLHFTSLHFTSLHFTLLYFALLLLYFTGTLLYFISLRFTSLHFISFHFTIHFTLLYFN